MKIYLVPNFEKNKTKEIYESTELFERGEDWDDEDFDEGDYYVDDEVEPEDERKDFITLDDF